MYTDGISLEGKGKSMDKSWRFLGRWAKSNSLFFYLIIKGVVVFVLSSNGNEIEILNGADPNTLEAILIILERSLK